MTRKCWSMDRQILIHAPSIEKFLRSTRPAEAAIAKVFSKFFAKIWQTNLISQIFWTRRTLGDVDNYVLSKFEPWTTLGGTKNVKKTKKNKSEFVMVSEISFSSFLINFGGARLFLMSKSSSSRFFALDGQIFGSVRRLQLILLFFTERTWTSGPWQGGE